MARLRVVVLPADESACGYYRMRLPAGAVREIRPEWGVEVYRPSDVKLGTGADGSLWGVQGLPEPDKMDLLVMQRVATRAQVEFIRWAQTKGTAVVVDSDDAMWKIHPDNVAWKSWNEGPHHWRWLDEAARFADLSTVTTPALAKRYGPRVEVLPNCVPGDVDSVRSELDQTVTIGWAGFTSTHPGDLTVVGDAVRRVQEETGCIVRVIGDAEGASRDWGCPVEKVNPTPIGSPYYTALTTLDVGLVPLQDSPFNRAKSYLKALEFSANGVVVVASPTPANRDLAKTVPIELASTPEDWYEAIFRAVVKAEWRTDRAREAKEKSLQRHTYSVKAELWVQAWERALNRRARMAA